MTESRTKTTTTIAAIYARKSTDQAVADEAKSVRRQIENARQYAARKGWSVSEAHVYVDDGVSGAEFANRPGFMRLMSSVKPQPVFDVLIMSEDSRLAREWQAAHTRLSGIRVGLIQFRGHLSYGGYDVQTDGRYTEAAATPPAVH